MRLEDIRFKAKRLDNSEWVVGDLYHNVRGYDCIGQLEGKDVMVYPVDPSTVCQFTGLKDKNGKEVWEHDLLQTGKHLAEVLWNEKLACFCTQPDFEEVMGITPLGSVLRIWKSAKVFKSKFDKEV